MVKIYLLLLGVLVAFEPISAQTNIEMAADGAATMEAARSSMNVELDKRLLPLKTKDAKQFSIEMGVQKDFNQAVDSFCAFYRETCGGSVCSICISGCFEAMYSYRLKQAREINEARLEVSAPGKLAPKYASKHFLKFAAAICGMPPDVFKDKKPAPSCVDRVLESIERDGIAPLKRSPNNEGDVCAQLP